MKKLLALALFSFLLVSCSKDTDTIDTSSDLTAQIETPIKDQVPNRAYDTESNGIYHGIVASGETTSRGKIWINLGNISLYNASIEMVTGDVFDFVLKNDDNQLTRRTEFEFTGAAGEFTVDVSDINAPLVTEVVLNNLPYFSSVVKSRNIMAAVSRTGTFSDPVNTTFTGTWNIISDGTVMNPNNFEGQTITSVVVTYNGVMYTDTTMEVFYFECIPSPIYIPAMNEFETNSIFAGAQNSVLGGATTWSLGVYPPSLSGYLNLLDCSDVSGGAFSWAHPTNGLTRSGTILID